MLEVLEVAAGQHQHLPVADIVGLARQAAGDLSIQTVYDCLDVLAGAQLVRRVDTPGFPARYEARVGDNHHHLVCRGCGKTVDVDCAVGATPCLEPSDNHGFVVDEAEVVFWGQCSGCHSNDQKAPATKGTP